MLSRHINIILYAVPCVLSLVCVHGGTLRIRPKDGGSVHELGKKETNPLLLNRIRSLLWLRLVVGLTTMLERLGVGIEGSLGKSLLVGGPVLRRRLCGRSRFHFC